LALTATATPRVRREIREHLHLRDPVQVLGTFDRPNLTWEVREAKGHGEKMVHLQALLRKRAGANIVYASTRKTVEAVCQRLAARGLPAIPYHAGLPPGVRTRVQERFLADTTPIVVATNAFGMGIDRADVRSVLHYQLPGSLEAYYQEAGRAGRDGSEANCVALFGKRDRKVHDRFRGLAYPKEVLLRRFHRYLLTRARPYQERRLPLGELVAALGKRGSQEEAVALLRALARCGSLVFEEVETEMSRMPSGASRGRAGEAPKVSIVLLSSSPRLGGLARLRVVEERQIASVLAYARERRCRRRALLAYFGEAVGHGSCGKCDRCRRKSGER
jgi:ATP-dependent DNA helicase RecQ